MKPSFTRTEIAAVLIVFAIGVYLRAAWPERMAVEHFDEGVYASNLYSPFTNNRYPDQHLYAPPLLPFLLEWAAILGGPHAVMWVNVAAGSVTLLVLWGMVRAWWGPPAAIAAMTLLALNEFHIAYSRAALTDVLLCLWMTAGVWAGWRAVLYGGVFNILAAGVLAGLAWWTKYNGWLTLAVTGAGTAGWQLWDALATRKRESPSAVASIRTYVLRWLATAIVAFLIWSPWLWELRRFGGYSRVATNHAGYFSGLGSWVGNAVQQAAAISHYGLAWILCGLLLAVLLEGVRWSDRARNPNVSPLAGWMAAAWLIGLSLAVPLYRPYPRLALPWVISLCIVLSGGFQGLMCRLFPARPADGGADRASWSARRVDFVSRLAAATGLLVIGFVTSLQVRHPAFEDRTAFQQIAEQAVNRLKTERLDRQYEGYRCTIYVLAEPGLFFHLAAAQPTSPIDHLTQAASDYGMAQPGGHRAGIPAYLLVGPHADQQEADRLIAEGRLTLLAEFDYRPSDLVLLDDQPAWDVEKLAKSVTQRIRLFHVKTE